MTLFLACFFGSLAGTALPWCVWILIEAHNDRVARKAVPCPQFKDES